LSQIPFLVINKTSSFRLYCDFQEESFFPAVAFGSPVLVGEANVACQKPAVNQLTTAWQDAALRKDGRLVVGEWGLSD